MSEKSPADPTELAALRAEVDGLRTALLSRAGIDQARGILIARYRISADQAFRILVRWSQERNVKLRLVAEALVALVQHGPAARDVDPALACWLLDQLGGDPGDGYVSTS